MISIQPLGQGHRRDACGIVAKDPPNHFGLDWDDLPITRRRWLAGICYSPYLIAIAKTAAGLAERDAASEATSCLVREILQEQRVHRALQAYVQVCDVAFGEGDDVHAGEREALEEAGRVFLITAESIQRFGEDDVETPIQSITHQCLESRTQESRARHSMIGEFLSHRPPLARGIFAAHPQLVGDRRVALVV